MSGGITHIEELDAQKFIQVLQNLSEYEATEKLDGSQILFGIDENGFYTSRESKGGERVYDINTYELTFSNTYKRSAHRLLEEVLPSMRAAGLKVGDQVEAEVLYGFVPNVVPYSTDTNNLIFLRTTEGTVDINALNKALENTIVDFPLIAPTTSDGKHIRLETNYTKWKIARSPILNLELDNMIRYTQWQVDRIEKKLNEPSGILNATNQVILNTPLNKIPDWIPDKDWKTRKVEIKKRKQELEEEILADQLYIKTQILIPELIYPTASAFGPVVSDGGWIEGIVLRHKVTGEMVKIVDKAIFNRKRIDGWAERNKLTERPRSLNTNCSFLGELLTSIGMIFSVPELGTTQAKKFYNPDNYQAAVGTRLRERITIFLIEKTQDLQDRLDKYEKKVSAKKITNAKTTFGKQLSKEIEFPSIHARTLETFATLFEHLEILKQKVQIAKTEEDIVKAIFGKYLE